MTVAALFRRWGLLALGLILIVTGCVMASQSLTFGWFGYADGGTFMQFSPHLVVLPPAAAATLLAGAVAIAGGVGFLLGSRSRPGTTAARPDA